MQDAPPPPSPAAGSDRASTRLEKLVQRARLALFWERLWPALWPPAAVVALFLVASWLGLWALVPAGYRGAGVGLFALAFIASLWPLARLSWPSRSAGLHRLDRDSPVPNRPASTFDDTLAIGRSDPATVALWEVHRRRTRAAIDRLTVRAPRPGMTGRDRYALRAIPILALIAAAFVAGPDAGSRLLTAFDWRNAPDAGPAFRIDGWIDPPLYTRVPPVMLDLARAGGTQVRVPVKSTLVLRFAGEGGITLKPGPGLAAVPAAADAAPGIEEHRFTITDNARLDLDGPDGATSLAITAIPDHPPEIRLSGDPETNGRGALTLAYRIKDDYGIATAEAVFEPQDGTIKRSLVPPPRIPLALPGDPAADEDTRTTTDLSAHAWAGGRLRMTLVARDEAGQESRSQTVLVTLPQRPFTKPLARALVEQRRNLIMNPDDTKRVRTAIEALMVAPEDFTPKDGEFLGLTIADNRLAKAKSDAELLDVADFLWEMAVQIEDGDLTQAQRDLKAAQEALRQALERGASPEEIKRLTDELRQALNRFLNEFAQQQMQQPQNQQSARQDPSRTITQDDLNRMLDRMEQMARQGATAEAQNLLDQMKDILDNLQGSQQAGQDPLGREMQQALNELDSMIRDQQALRDDTFRQDGGENSELSPPRRGRNGQRQQGQQGQQGQRGQQGQQGEQGQQGMSSEELAQRQQALRERLQELQRRMKGMGLQGEEGLNSAEEAMRDAEGQLGQGETGEALDSQGEALEGLQRGAQGMAQQMQPGDGQGNEQAGNGQPGRSGRQSGMRDTDPLGRPTRNRDWSDGRVRIPTADESATVRARRILDELRRRLGDQLRPREELDYLERLLRNQ
jgi:uncharacterized protein (TIGR02302 family)